MSVLTNDVLNIGKFCRYGNLIENLTEWSHHCCQNIGEINWFKHGKKCDLILPALVWIKLDNEACETEDENKIITDNIEIETKEGNTDIDDIDEIFKMYSYHPFTLRKKKRMTV